ncbi:MAG: hypothetical protein OXC67_09560 [Flavobacteriaceae bacterium]|nr:hypothetical protein [Flavobacteriaceae bacterium]
MGRKLYFSVTNKSIKSRFFIKVKIPIQLRYSIRRTQKNDQLWFYIAGANRYLWNTT